MIEPFIFTKYEESEGHFGVGKVPNDIVQYTSKIHDLFYNTIPKDKLNEKTYHQWFEDFTPEIKSYINKINKNKLWEELCTDGNKCSIVNITEMDELYYSKAPNIKNKDTFLYGATGNFDPHIDGVFSFPGIRLYRVLIGLTPDNEKIETNFLKLDITHKIQKDDYIVFDFDKAIHQVINHSDKDQGKYRIMLKLHYLVCDKCAPNSSYMNFVKQSYITYEYITRYFMQKGTDPRNLYEFFIGVFCMFLNTFKIIGVILLIFFLSWPFAYLWKRNAFWKSILFYINTAWVGGLFSVSFILWVRYLLTNKR